MVAGLGDSPVPLDQDVVKRKPLIVSPTFMEWVADGNAEQIFITGGISSAGRTTAYTTPKNFTLFITNISITIRCSTGAPSSRIGSVEFNAGDTAILQAVIVGGNTASSNSMSYPMPLRRSSGEVITIAVNAGASVNFVIQGFLLPLKLSIR